MHCNLFNFLICCIYIKSSSKNLLCLGIYNLTVTFTYWGKNKIVKFIIYKKNTLWFTQFWFSFFLFFSRFSLYVKFNYRCIFLFLSMKENRFSLYVKFHLLLWLFDAMGYQISSRELEKIITILWLRIKITWSNRVLGTINIWNNFSEITNQYNIALTKTVYKWEISWPNI